MTAEPEAVWLRVKDSSGDILSLHNNTNTNNKDMKKEESPVSMTDELAQTVADVKNAVYEARGIPVVNQRLLYKGKRLADERTLKSYDIKEGATILLLQCSPYQDHKLGVDANDFDSTPIRLSKDTLAVSIIRALLLDKWTHRLLRFVGFVITKLWHIFVRPAIKHGLQAFKSSWLFAAYLAVTFAWAHLSSIAYLAAFGITMLVASIRMWWNINITVLRMIFKTVVHGERREGNEEGEGEGESEEGTQRGWMYKTVETVIAHRYGLVAMARFGITLIGAFFRRLWSWYSRKGRTVNGFTLGILPGNLERQNEDYFYAMNPRQQYAVYIHNDNKTAALCRLYIEGEHCGTFSMQPNAGYTITRRMLANSNNPSRNASLIHSRSTSPTTSRTSIALLSHHVERHHQQQQQLPSPNASPSQNTTRSATSSPSARRGNAIIVEAQFLPLMQDQREEEDKQRRGKRLSVGGGTVIRLLLVASRRFSQPNLSVNPVH